MKMVDFLYHGEANVHQENLDSFLALADELQLKGLKREEEVESVPKKNSNRQRYPISGKTNNPDTTPEDKITSEDLQNEVIISPSTETAIAHNNFSGGTDLEELDTKVK